MASSKKLQIRTADGLVDCTEHRPDGPGPWPAVLFFMDALGVRDTLRGMADRLADHGFYVLLPNLFYRSGTYEPFDPRTFWSNPDERSRIMGLIATLTPDRVKRDVAAYLDAISAAPDVKSDKVGCVGYCMGGMISLRVAAMFPDRIAAAASIHGGFLATDKPDSPHLGAPDIRGRIYVGAAEGDRAFTAEQRQMLETALRAAGVRHTVELYTGAHHGFAVPDFPVYDQAASERHWERVLQLFNETLRGGDK